MDKRLFNNILVFEKNKAFEQGKQATMTQTNVASSEQQQWWKSQYMIVDTNYALNADEASQAIAALDQLRKQVDCLEVDLNNYDRIVLQGIDGFALHTILHRGGNAATYRVGPSRLYCWLYRTNRLLMHHKLEIAAAFTIAALSAIVFYTK